MGASATTKKEKLEERIGERKLIVHKVAIDLDGARNVMEKDKTGFLQNWAS